MRLGICVEDVRRRGKTGDDPKYIRYRHVSSLLGRTTEATGFPWPRSTGSEIHYYGIERDRRRSVSWNVRGDRAVPPPRNYPPAWSACPCLESHQDDETSRWSWVTSTRVARGAYVASGSRDDAIPVQVQPAYRRLLSVGREADRAREARWRPGSPAARSFEGQVLFPWLPCNGPWRRWEVLSGSSWSRVTGAGWGSDP